MYAGMSQYVREEARGGGYQTAACITRRNVLALVTILRRYHCRSVRKAAAKSELDYCTVDVYLALLHELAELSEPLGGVDLFHLEYTTHGGGVKGSVMVEG